MDSEFHASSGLKTEVKIGPWLVLQESVSADIFLDIWLIERNRQLTLECVLLPILNLSGMACTDLMGIPEARTPLQRGQFMHSFLFLSRVCGNLNLASSDFFKEGDMIGTWAASFPCAGPSKAEGRQKQIRSKLGLLENVFAASGLFGKIMACFLRQKKKTLIPVEDP